MLSLSVPNAPASASGGLRPVNLRTDLAPLADLIELAFSDSMDSSGHAAVREMRALSHIGPGLNILAGVNDLTQGINFGYVWIARDKLIGNVSIYPANYPAQFGTAWIIANVAVHPDYRGRGIAARLMEASMNAIRARGGALAILQVERDNTIARRLYENLGFITERTWVNWRRSSMLPAPAPLEDRGVFISRRRRGEWRGEFALAQRLFPSSRGGMGWLRPLYAGLFRPSLTKRINDWLNLRTTERLVIRSRDERHVLAALWLFTGFMTSTVELKLLVEPDYQGWYDEALLNLAVRRSGARQPLIIEHPADDEVTTALLQKYAFRPQRTLVHMRWQPRH